MDGDVSDVKGNRTHIKNLIVGQAFINAECLFQRLAMRILFWYLFSMHLNPSSILGYLVVCLVCVVHNVRANPHLQLGPMLGHVGSHEARIWVKASETARLSVIFSHIF